MRCRDKVLSKGKVHCRYKVHNRTKVHITFCSLPLWASIVYYVLCLGGSRHEGATKPISLNSGESESLTEHTSPLVQLMEEGVGGIVQYGLQLTAPPSLRHHFQAL